MLLQHCQYLRVVVGWDLEVVVSQLPVFVMTSVLLEHTYLAHPSESINSSSGYIKRKEVYDILQI